MSEEAKVGGYCWPYESDDDETAQITDMPSPEPSGDLKIPKKLGGLPVTAVHCWFEDCEDLETVSIPATVTDIEWEFSFCRGLREFKVAAGNPAYASVDGLLLTKDGRKLISGVNRETVDIPAGVTEIGPRTFNYFEDLWNVTIPASVTKIGDEAFRACLSLQSVEIPDGVEEIGDGAFNECCALTSLTIPASVEQIGDGAFGYCGPFESIVVAPGNPAYVVRDGFLMTKDGKTLLRGTDQKGKVVIPSGVKKIDEGAFGYFGELTEVVIPDGATSIGEHAFDGCCRLAEVTIPKSVTHVGEYAFNACDSLKKIKVYAGDTQRVKELLRYVVDLTSRSIEFEEIGEPRRMASKGGKKAVAPKSKGRAAKKAKRKKVV